MPLTLEPASVVRVGVHWTCAVNRNQNLLGKLVYVANRDVASVDELDTAEWLALQEEMRTGRAALNTLFQPDQINYAFLMNLDAQVHLHLVPRYIGKRRWDGEAFADPHFGGLFGTEQRKLSPGRLRKLADAVRAALPGNRP